MKFLVCCCLILLPARSFSQTDDGSDFAAGISSYFFRYKDDHGGSTAIGPTVFWRNGDVALQTGLLLDLQPYETYIQNSSGNSVSTKRSFLLPVLGHYRFYHKEQIGLFATFGFIIGGKYYLDEYDRTQTTDAFSFLFGAGASYAFSEHILLRLSPNFRYSQEKFNAGLMVDLIYRFGGRSASSE